MFFRENPFARLFGRPIAISLWRLLIRYAARLNREATRNGTGESLDPLKREYRSEVGDFGSSAPRTGPIILFDYSFAYIRLERCSLSRGRDLFTGSITETPALFPNHGGRDRPVGFFPLGFHASRTREPITVSKGSGRERVQLVPQVHYKHRPLRNSFLSRSGSERLFTR